MTRATPLRNILPTAAILKRREPPECLYIVVDSVAFPTIDHKDGSIVKPSALHVRAKHNFTCADLTLENLRAHLVHSNCTSIESRFISAFEGEATALHAHPMCASDTSRNGSTTPHATKLIIDASKLSAGWIDTSSFGRMPVWLEHGELPKVPRVRSISSEEQEEHIKEQIARNRASRDDLRLGSAEKGQNKDTTKLQVRRTIDIRQDRQQVRSCGTTEFLPEACQQDTSPRDKTTLPFISGSKLVVAQESYSRYNLVRSSKLRDALQRSQASKPREYLHENDIDSSLVSQIQTDELVQGKSNVSETQGVDEGPSGPGQVRRKTETRRDPYKQTTERDSKNTPGMHWGKKSSLRNVSVDGNSDSLPRAERLRRARAGKKKVEFVEPDPDSQPEVESKFQQVVETILDSVMETRDTDSALDRSMQRKLELTLAGLPLSSKQSLSSDEVLSLAGMDSGPDEKAFFVRGADISESQMFVLDRGCDSRPKTRPTRGKPTS
ncbi:hypothetical protein OPT61_g8084 [Boeremia exigua]|uniref:Uncharacterized protein n=1 Tax=Boeremia exigua TaxID=749465 RepID=A0ACC2I090_9PLEO|nr:hypothetical protein OPT61_g8084 [Boeremia exigua]